MAASSHLSLSEKFKVGWASTLLLFGLEGEPSADGEPQTSPQIAEDQFFSGSQDDVDYT